MDNLEKKEEPPDDIIVSNNNLLAIQKAVDWKQLIKECVISPKELIKISGLDDDSVKKICSKYPVRIPRYYLSLIKEKDDGIFKQCVPALEEIEDNFGYEDPLNEEIAQKEGQVPVGITHRYPDRVLFLISNQCAMYCRFCTRKRKVGDVNKPKRWGEILQGIEYIKNHPEIRDVILSGGDPLMLNDFILEKIIKRVREIPHVEIIRIGSRMPCTLPQRITQELCDMLRKYHPIYLNTHFNHPAEITNESAKACSMLADAGIPVGNQTVLLKGVNDNPETMKELMQRLVKIRVRPYYIYQADLVIGTNHFRTRVEKGLEIIKAIRGHTSGLCVPHFVIDAPGGGGKIPVLPEYVKSIDDKKIIMSNYKDNFYEYVQVE